MLSSAIFIIVLIFFSWFAFLKKLVAILLVSVFLSYAIMLPSFGSANAIDSALRPVKVPTSSIFFEFEILIINSKK